VFFVPFCGYQVAALQIAPLNRRFKAPIFRGRPKMVERVEVLPNPNRINLSVSKRLAAPQGRIGGYGSVLAIDSGTYS
jgi:hypothetical protein